MGGIEVDDGLRDGDDVDVMGRRGEVGRADLRDRDLARLVELDPETTPVVPRARASGRRRGRRSPAGECTGRIGRSTSESQAPISPPRLRSG